MARTEKQCTIAVISPESEAKLSTDATNTPDNLANSKLDDITSALLGLAVESWRFSRSYERLVRRLDKAEQARFHNQQRYFQQQVEEKLRTTGFKLVDLEGQSFDAGMAATAINLADFEPGVALVVDQMLEPVIMDSLGLVKMGTVLLKTAEQE